MLILCVHSTNVFNENIIKYYSKCSKIPNTFPILFSTKLLVIRAGIHIFLIRIANREGPDQTACLLLQNQSDLGLSCLPRPFWLTASVRHLDLFIVP